MIDHARTATWTRARTDKNGRRLPQSIAHRGYKAKHPENTMGAFVGAVEAGAHAIETDIHLSMDDVVVLSHVRLVPAESLAFRNCLRNLMLCRTPHSNDASERKIS